MSVIRRLPERRGQSDRREGVQIEIDRQLRAALDNDEIEIDYQPQFRSSDGALIGAEALARWRHPRRGRLGGDALFAFARRTSIAGELSHHVVRLALADARQWPAHLKLSLNVTAGDLASAGFADRIAAEVRRSGFPFERLTVEITEEALVANFEACAAQLQQLADLGAHIALDDFGAGFCNFRYLKHLPLDCLKIDRSLVEGVGDDHRDLEIFRGILAMARALGLSVVAEGIENDRQLAAIVREGCANWQGFLGAEPMSPVQFLIVARLAAQ